MLKLLLVFLDYLSLWACNAPGVLHLHNSRRILRFFFRFSFCGCCVHMPKPQPCRWTIVINLKFIYLKWIKNVDRSDSFIIQLTPNKHHGIFQKYRNQDIHWLVPTRMLMKVGILAVNQTEMKTLSKCNTYTTDHSWARCLTDQFVDRGRVLT